MFFQTIVSVDLRRNYLGGQNLSGMPQFEDGFGYPCGKPLHVHRFKEREEWLCCQISVLLFSSIKVVKSV